MQVDLLSILPMEQVISLKLRAAVEVKVPYCHKRQIVLKIISYEEPGILLLK
jgi:hypothetical protein